MFHSDSAFATLTSQTLTHEQKLMNLAKEAENAFDVLDIPYSRKGSPLPRDD